MQVGHGDQGPRGDASEADQLGHDTPREPRDDVALAPGGGHARRRGRQPDRVRFRVDEPDRDQRREERSDDERRYNAVESSLQRRIERE